MHEVKIYIYDKNGSCKDWSSSCSETDDIFRGNVTTTTYGSLCAFVQDGDNVYFVSKMENIYGTVKISNSLNYAVSSPILYSNINGTQNVNWNISCYNETDGLCNSQYQIDTSYPVTSGYVSILESLYDSGIYFENNNILNLNGINYPSNEEFIVTFPESSTNCSNNPNTANSPDNQTACFGTNRSDDNHVVAHELGHMMHRRALNYKGSLSSGSCINNYDWHSINTGDKCAISEGFAYFISGAVYWEDDAVDPWIQNKNEWYIEGDTDEGNNNIFKECVSYSSDTEKVIGNGTRFFWDLFDSTEDGTGENSLTDDSNLSFYNIVNEWDSFPSGTSNRQNNESSVNGRN